jgi:hypothetical protein
MPKQWMSSQCLPGGTTLGGTASEPPLRYPELRIAMMLTVSPCHGSVPRPSVTRRSHTSDLRRLHSCGTSNFPDRPHVVDGGAHADQPWEHGMTR